MQSRSSAARRAPIRKRSLSLLTSRELRGLPLGGIRTISPADVSQAMILSA